MGDRLGTPSAVGFFFPRSIFFYKATGPFDPPGMVGTNDSNPIMRKNTTFLVI